MKARGQQPSILKDEGYIPKQAEDADFSDEGFGHGKSSARAWEDSIQRDDVADGEVGGHVAVRLITPHRAQGAGRHRLVGAATAVAVDHPGGSQDGIASRTAGARGTAGAQFRAVRARNRGGGAEPVSLRGLSAAGAGDRAGGPLHLPRHAHDGEVATHFIPPRARYSRCY